jgi:hypothetical protein
MSFHPSFEEYTMSRPGFAFRFEGHVYAIDLRSVSKVHASERQTMWDFTPVIDTGTFILEGFILSPVGDLYINAVRKGDLRGQLHGINMSQPARRLLMAMPVAPGRTC